MRWREDPSLDAPAVEELLRFDGPVHLTGRIPVEDVEINGHVFPRGKPAVTLLAAANRDPARFDHADRLDLLRPDNHQLTFSQGIHYCLGAALARAELQEALPLLAQRMPKLTIDGDITWKPEGVGIFGPEHMPITFAPGH